MFTKSIFIKGGKTMEALQLVKVDYQNEQDTKALINLLQMYAQDPMGGNKAIDQSIIDSLPKALQARSFMHSFLVYSNQTPIAFANCIESFSTFSAKGVLNIHDFAVMPTFRGQNISQFLLSGIQNFATKIGCSKLTLEVLEGNKSAVRAYQKAGFSAYQLAPEMGNAMFWQKNL